jgi:hypothetical protein
VQAQTLVVGASVRGEVSPEVLAELATKDTRVAVDVQGFVRVARNGKLVYKAWPQK